jgi:hypothetical protein
MKHGETYEDLSGIYERAGGSNEANASRSALHGSREESASREGLERSTPGSRYQMEGEWTG